MFMQTASVKKLLFYIEPAEFRGNQLLLHPWYDFCHAAALRSQPARSFLASSPSLCRLPCAAFEASWEIDPAAVIASNHDRVFYARDVCVGSSFRNVYLLERLKQIDDALRPDYVISWSENNYLRKTFGRRVLFMELGPLPRSGLKISAFLDPFGHQVGCAFQSVARRSCDGDYTAFASAWERTWLKQALALGEEAGCSDWLNRTRAGGKMLLAVLQPPDWLTYEGIGPALEPIALLQHIARDIAPADWLVIPQWHPGNSMPGEAELEKLEAACRNVRTPPPSLRIGQSEVMLPHVGAVATISSNVAAAAAIIGKPVRVLGQSKFAALDAPTFSAVPRPDLLAFMAGRYCRPRDDWMSNDGEFITHLERLACDPGWLSRDIHKVDPGVLCDFMT